MKIAIIDDFALDRQQFIEYLKAYLSDSDTDLFLSIEEFKSGEEFLDDFTPDFWDLILIDYYMEQLSGLDTARKIREQDRSVSIIFITASSDYAIDCYKVKAAGYLVKPVTYEDFSEILSLLEWDVFYERRYLEIPDGAKRIRIFVRDIIYCDISGHYVQIHTQYDGTIRCRTTFEKVVSLLSAYSDFLLCYRGCLLNMNHIRSMDEMNFYMISGERLPYRKREHQQITRTYSDFLFQKKRKLFHNQTKQEDVKWN